MNLIIETQLVNLLGYVVGGALFLLLGAAVLREKDESSAVKSGDKSAAEFFGSRRLLLAFSALGVVWNFGQFNIALATDLSAGKSFPFWTALVYAALGFLPALLVAIETRNENKDELRIQNKYRVAGAYLLSSVAATMHFFGAATGGALPSQAALQILAAGYLIIAGLIFLDARGGFAPRRFSRVFTLALFVFSLVHLSFAREEGGFHPFELVGHQASLPLVSAVLYRNFRLSFADVFLKRALSLIFLAALVFAVYAVIVEPLSALHRNHPANDPLKTGVMLVVWMLTALLSAPLYRIAARIVDRRLLSRPDYSKIKNEFMQKVFASERIEEILDEAGRACAGISNARDYAIREKDWKAGRDFSLAEPAAAFENNTAAILIPTVEKPRFEISLTGLNGARRILSEEIETLESLALQCARRIDVLRVSHERCERELREQEFATLATQAELRALRSQINPHFLFNALTTIGYLIDTAPDKALATLLQLTGLLRGVLGANREFHTLGEELKLIESYLEIEKTRFEDRLHVRIDLPERLSSVRIPALVLQPIVENAVKHGISPKKEGGLITISATNDERVLILRVTDTGSGLNENELRERIEKRVGLKNIEQRLRLYFGTAARLEIKSSESTGTTVGIEIENEFSEPSRNLFKLPEKRPALSF